ncbi:hypothetical protein ACFWEJ_04505 [Promicromonospora sp. NPDC060204]|uniref:hypothetical protein n=1 Tax=Promicromonospora sp. NPDC060204 TaxID=3347071 RepID=UPI00364E20E7
MRALASRSEPAIVDVGPETGVAVVIASLYPAIPVLLGVTVHHERLGRTQALGLVAAGIAVALLSIG